MSADNARMTTIHDASAMAAIRRLKQTAGAQIDAKELLHAIRTGTADRDGRAASTEWKDFHRFAKAHGDELTPAAKKLMGVYDSFANAARTRDQSGLTLEQMKKMFGSMGQVAAAEGVRPPPPSPAPPSRLPVGGARPNESAKHQLARLNPFFKRQAYDATWNPTGPSRSGNCAVCSLAMAAEAFGKEPSRFAAMGRKGVQPSIDWMARKMGKSPVSEKEPHNFGSTSVAQVEKGARNVGLNTRHINPTSNDLSPLDKALGKGQMVVLTGGAGRTYREAMGHDFSEPHSILVMGKTNDGRYVVADPLSRRGNRALTRAEMASFMRQHVAGGTAVWP